MTTGTLTERVAHHHITSGLWPSVRIEIRILLAHRVITKTAMLTGNSPYSIPAYFSLPGMRNSCASRLNTYLEGARECLRSADGWVVSPRGVSA